MALGGIISVVGQIGKCLLDPIGRHFGYLYHYKSNLESLVKEFNILEPLRCTEQLKVDGAERNGEEILPSVKEWLGSVDLISSEVNVILEEGQAYKGCLNGWCSNPIARHSLGRKAEKKVEEMVKLRERGKFDRVSHPAPPPKIERRPNDGIIGFNSRILILKKVLEALKEDAVHMVGICGMGGVGKTTLAEEVSKKANEETLFDEVGMAVVSQYPDVRRIQGEIADQFGIKFTQETESGRADFLREQLKRKKKILIILDDIWKRIELKNIGIPFGDTNGGCKILLTSRSEDTCNDMGAQKIFPVEVFPREEAWNLFKEIAGISRALGNLNQLKLLDLLRCHVRRIPHGVLSSLSKLEELYLGTSFSRWDVVEEVKDITITNACIAELALLPNLVALDIYVPHTECSVWPSDVVLPENIRAFDISLGDIRGKNVVHHLYPSTNRLAVDSLDESRSFMEIRGLKMLLKITSFLLLRSVRLGNHNFFALDEDGFQHLSELEVDNCLDLECLVNTSDSYQAKEAFCALKILRLSYLPQLMHLWKGPTQLACLRNLMKVSVYECPKLKHCVFSLAIARNLVHLQDIKVSFCYELEVIVSNIGGGEHEIESTVAEQEDEIVFPELKSLNLWGLPKFTDFHKAKNAIKVPRLKSLELQEIPKLNCLCLPSRSNYDASIQPLFNNKDTLSTLEELHVTELNDLREIWPGDLQAKLKRIEVYGCDKLPNILFPSNLIQCMQKLELLGVAMCKSVEVAFDLSRLYVDEKGDGPAAAIALPCLATLRFLNLPNLKHVWANYPPTILQGFQNLKSVYVVNCGSLRILFSPFVARLLVNLRELYIASCGAMVAIIGWEQEEEEDDGFRIDTSIFPQLAILGLWDLKLLTSFCPQACTFQGSVLEYVEIRNCPAMESLPSAVQRVINEQGR